MSTLTDKLPKLPDLKLPEVLDLGEAKKPAYAAAGVVDLYVEQVKEIPTQAKKLQAELTAKLDAARTERAAQVKALPATTKKLQVEWTKKAEKAQADVVAYYEKLAHRGEKLVAQIRRQPTTAAAVAEGKAAVKKATEASTATKKATKSSAKAVESAAEKIG